MEELNNGLLSDNKNLQLEYDNEMAALISLNEKFGDKLDSTMEGLDAKAKLLAVVGEKETGDENLDNECKELTEENEQLLREYAKLVENKKRLEQDLKGNEEW